MSDTLHVGLIVNPLAGFGGGLALKGSDGEQVRALARCREPAKRQRALERAQRALALFDTREHLVQFSCWVGDMGASTLQRLGIPARVLGEVGTAMTSADDTRKAVTGLLQAGVDVIIFAGGDGTARDIHDVVGSTFPVLGIPAGVKMHSGVFAVSPEAAGELLLQLASGSLVGLKAQEVRDIDEEAFRHDVVKSRFYGELMAPGQGQYLQHTKIGGREDPALVATDIAAWLAETMLPDHLYLIGPGSTTAAVMEELELPNTLLGVDVVRDGSLLLADANEEQLLKVLAAVDVAATIVATVIGGQGYLFGRGNQQFSPAVIRAVGLENITIIAAKSKIAQLEGRPLLVDTNDPDLDTALSGYKAITTGYDDQVMYRINRA